MNAKLIDKKTETKSICSFYFIPQSKLDFSAGQYIYLSIPSVTNDPRGCIRQFTVSSSPKESFIQITTEIHLNSPFKRVLNSLKINDQVDIDGPMGSMFISIPQRYTFIAAGLGITPFKSMIETFINDLKFNFELFHFVDENNQNLFQTEKKLWLSNPNIKIKTIKKEITEKYLPKNVQNPVYICGSPKNVKIINSIISKDTNEALIITEKLTGISFF